MPLTGVTDAKGQAFIEMKHPEYVSSVGIFTTDGRVIDVTEAKKWPMTVRITGGKRQTITVAPENR